MITHIGDALYKLGKGNKRTISTSNTRKITANRKKRIENGARVAPTASKPHSNVNNFSRSWVINEICTNQIRINVILTMSLSINEKSLRFISIRGEISPFSCRRAIVKLI